MKKLYTIIFMGLLISSSSLTQNEDAPPVTIPSHCPSGVNASFLFPGKIHNHEAGPDQSKMYDPLTHKHASVAGPDQSRIFPNNFMHNPIAGADQSRLFPDWFIHNPIAGVDQSRLFPDWFVHNPTGTNQSTMIHGRDSLVHCSTGADESRMIPVYMHVPEGPDESRMVKLIVPVIVQNTDKNGEAESNNNSEKLSLDIYPNPVVDAVSISPVIIPEFVNNAQVKLYDMSGKLVKTIEIPKSTNNVVTINISDLSSGIYTGSIEMNGTPTLMIKKIIKQ